jgi:RNA polymerase sigma-70 factor (ECF subfamily)
MNFESFYEKEFRPVLGLAFVLAGNPQAAEELAQEAFIAALRDWSRVQTLDSPGAWIRRVVARRAVSLVRRRVVAQRPHPVTHASSRFEPQMSVETEHIWAAVRALPTKQAQCVSLRYLEGFSTAEIAEVLERSENTIKTHLRRANVTLARKLRKEKAT